MFTIECSLAPASHLLVQNKLVRRRNTCSFDSHRRSPAGRASDRKLHHSNFLLLII